MYYWSFNNETTFTTPDIGLDGAGLEAQLAGLTELTTGDGQDFSGLNARNGDPAGAHLRFNNPVGSSLTFSVPTTGFENIVFKYETRRSNSGANTQFITYTLDGQTYQSFPDPGGHHGSNPDNPRLFQHRRGRQQPRLRCSI